MRITPPWMICRLHYLLNHFGGFSGLRKAGRLLSSGVLVLPKPPKEVQEQIFQDRLCYPEHYGVRSNSQYYRDEWAKRHKKPSWLDRLKRRFTHD